MKRAYLRALRQDSPWLLKEEIAYVLYDDGIYSPASRLAKVAPFRRVRIVARCEHPPWPCHPLRVRCLSATPCRGSTLSGMDAGDGRPRTYYGRGNLPLDNGTNW